MKVTYQLTEMFRIFILFIILGLTSCSKNKTTEDNFASLPIRKYCKAKLEKDFDILVSSLKEAHTGLYWYSSPREFDSIAKVQRSKIKDGLNGLEFYNITAPVVAFTKEDHCDITLSEEVSEYLNMKGRFIPITIVNLKEKAFILNDPQQSVALKGWQLLKINNRTIEDIYNHIFNTFGSDGFIKSSKYRFMDIYRLAVEYAKTIEQPEEFEITALNPQTGKKKTVILKAIAFNELKDITKTLINQSIIKEADIPAKFETQKNTAILTINTFSNESYKEADMDFKEFIKHSFDSIRKTGVKNLIIDVRENGGGSEGNEDYLFSFLTNKPYKKYKYVEASALSYSFYRYTDYSSEKDYKELESDLNKEHYIAPDGRFLRRPGVEPQAPLQPNPFSGNIYVLCSGWTYSGGAEFCSLMKSYTNAIFAGEEVGGAFYGNTSGYSFELMLPNTKLKIEIPILKFVLDVSENIPKGRGVLPDYPISPSIKQFLEGKDVEMEFVKKLISKRS